jgi:hypothetical protein
MVLTAIRDLEALNRFLNRPSLPPEVTGMKPPDDYYIQMQRDGLVEESDQTILGLVQKTRHELLEEGLSFTERKSLHNDLVLYEHELNARKLSVAVSPLGSALPPKVTPKGWFASIKAIVLPVGLSCFLLLLASLDEWPYGFYQLMRIVFCTSAAYLVTQAAKRDQVVFFWVMLGTALLFNPVFPVHMSRSDWQPIDLLAAAVFLASGYFLRAR